MDKDVDSVRDSILKRVKKYRAMYPGDSYDDALRRAADQLETTVEVEYCDHATHQCKVYQSRSEPVIKEPVRAADEVDARVQAYMDKRGCSYVEALPAVLREDKALARAYKAGPGQLFYND